MTNIEFERDKLIVRRIDERDAILITRWLSDPEVLQYYEGRDRPQGLEMVNKHYIDVDDNETRCIVEYDHVEIGYIQYYPVDEDGKKEYDCTDLEGNIYGMDQFIGEVDYCMNGMREKCETVGLWCIRRRESIMINLRLDCAADREKLCMFYEKQGFNKVNEELVFGKYPIAF